MDLKDLISLINFITHSISILLLLNSILSSSSSGHLVIANISPYLWILLNKYSVLNGIIGCKIIRILLKTYEVIFLTSILFKFFSFDKIGLTISKYQSQKLCQTNWYILFAASLNL